MASSVFESWITRLKVSWMGPNARRIFGAFAAALGDKTADWMLQATLEHMPGFASDPKSIALIADDRQLDTYPGEPAANIAARAPYWLQIHRFRGRGLGILLGLHFAGFDGAVLVQQNGRALQLTLPLPVFDGNWDPTPNLVITPCMQLATALTSSVNPPTVSQVGRAIPAGNSWWTFDNNTDFCSRFAVLYPTPPGNYPFSSPDLQRLKSTITKWRPAKATCLGVFVCTVGVFCGWPVRNPNTPRTRPSTVVQVLTQF
jgi:hypothetical protein